MYYFFGYNVKLEGMDVFLLPDDSRRVAFVQEIDENLRSDLLLHGVFSAVGQYFLEDVFDHVWVFKDQSAAFNFAGENLGVVSFYSFPSSLISDDLIGNG